MSDKKPPLKSYAAIVRRHRTGSTRKRKQDDSIRFHLMRIKHDAWLLGELTFHSVMTAGLILAFHRLNSVLQSVAVDAPASILMAYVGELAVVALWVLAWVLRTHRLLRIRQEMRMVFCDRSQRNPKFQFERKRRDGS